MLMDCFIQIKANGLFEIINYECTPCFPNEFDWHSLKQRCSALTIIVCCNRTDITTAVPSLVLGLNSVEKETSRSVVTRIKVSQFPSPRLYWHWRSLIGCLDQGKPCFLCMTIMKKVIPDTFRNETMLMLRPIGLWFWWRTLLVPRNRPLERRSSIFEYFWLITHVNFVIS